MVLHYQAFMKKMKSCPVPIAYGPSGTGKTTALHSGLSLLGADDLRFFRHLSPAKAMQLCSVTNIPLGLDDPDTKSSFCSLIMDLFNGVKKGTMTSGEFKPISSVVVSSKTSPRMKIRGIHIHSKFHVPNSFTHNNNVQVLIGYRIITSLA